jgi:hypothetical protein
MLAAMPTVNANTLIKDAEDPLVQLALRIGSAVTGDLKPTSDYAVNMRPEHLADFAAVIRGQAKEDFAQEARAKKAFDYWSDSAIAAMQAMMSSLKARDLECLASDRDEGEKMANKMAHAAHRIGYAMANARYRGLKLNKLSDD